MSTHLLTTRLTGENKLASRYTIRNNIDSTVQSSFSKEHNRMIYMFSVIGTNYVIQSFNMLTSEFVDIGVIPKSQLGNPSGSLGDICVNDEFMFVSRNDYTNIYRIRLSDLSVQSFNGTLKSTAWGQMEWYDEAKTILVLCTNSNGYILYDTITDSWSSIQATTSLGNRKCFANGKDTIISVSTSASGNFIIYDKTDNTWANQAMPSNALAVVCYNNGKYFFARQSYLYIYDEATRTFERTVPMPYENRPQSIAFSDGIVYVTIVNSQRIYAYDIANNMYSYLYMPWSMTNSDQIIVRITGFKKFVFVPHITFGIINYLSSSKYAFGYKMDQYNLIFNKDSESEFTKGDHITFEDSYVTLTDGVETKPLVDIQETIKSVHLNKNDYNLIKNISFKN